MPALPPRLDHPTHSDAKEVHNVVVRFALEAHDGCLVFADQI